MTGFDFDVIRRSLAYLFLEGMRFTMLAALGGIVFGTGIALLPQSGGRVLATVAAGYVNLMRALPLVLVIFWFCFLMPYLGQWVDRQRAAGRRRRILLRVDHLHRIRVGVLLGNRSCRDRQRPTRAGRSGAGARPDAASGDGNVILPQVFRIILPVLLTQAIVLFQDTSLVYVISLTDFLEAASKVAQQDGRLVEMCTFAALVYFAVSFLASQGVRRLQTRIAVPR